jgi:hypothetical protein
MGKDLLVEVTSPASLAKTPVVPLQVLYKQKRGRFFRRGGEEVRVEAVSLGPCRWQRWDVGVYMDAVPHRQGGRKNKEERRAYEEEGRGERQREMLVS